MERLVAGLIGSALGLLVSLVIHEVRHRKNEPGLVDRIRSGGGW